MPVYTNSNPLKYTKIKFYEEMDVVLSLKGAGGAGGGHPDNVNQDYRGGHGQSGEAVTGTVRVQAGDEWTVYIGGGGQRGLSWYLGGLGGLGGSSKSGFHGGAGGDMGRLGRSSGGGGGGGASLITTNNNVLAVAAGGGGGGGEGNLSSGLDAQNFLASVAAYGGSGATSATDDGGGGGGGGGGHTGGRGGNFGSGDTGGRGGCTGSSLAPAGTTVTSTGGLGGLGGSGDVTNNTNGGNGYFEITEFILPTHKYRGMYVKDGGTWKQPAPNVKHNGLWKQIQEGYVKHNGNWVRVYPPKVSVEITDYGVTEDSAGSPVVWNNTVQLVPADISEPPVQPPADNTPETFAFVDRFDLETGTEYTSNSVTITGINTPATVSATNSAQVSINGGPFVTSGTISNNSTLATRLRSSANNSTRSSTTITVGTVSTQWNITTKAALIPTYAIIPSTTIAREGTSVTWSVTTTNVANGTLFNWEIVGSDIEAKDFTDRLLTGTVTVNNNAGTITKTLVKDDGNAVPNETVIMKLKDLGGAVVATSASIEVVDVPEDTVVHPTSGTLISTYCKGFDKWGIYANGAGGTYDQVITVNSSDCGWTDEDPDAFSFTSITNADVNVDYTASATITGITSAVTVSSNGNVSFAKNGSTTFNNTVTVNNGDTVTVRGRASLYYNRTDAYSITVGKRTASWSIATKNGPKPVAKNINWAGPFNSGNETVSFDLAGNSINSSSAAFTSARILAQPKTGTVTLNGTTAVYTPNKNSSSPATLSDFQASIYVSYWTDLYPNGIKSTAMAKTHWTSYGIGEQRYIPTIFSGSDSFTWAISNEYGESNIASCLLQFSAPTVPSLDDVGPQIVAVAPVSGATKVDKNTRITVTYDEQLVPGTGTISMTGSNGTSYSWTNSTAELSGQLVSFSAGVLASGVTYTVSVPAGFAKDRANNNSAAHSWSFTIADTEGPYVTNVYRPPNSNHLVVEWSEPIDVAVGEVEINYYFWHNEWWNSGMWYAATYDIETITSSLVKIGSNTTRIDSGVARWVNQLFIPDGAVVDASGNANNYYSGWADAEPYAYNGYKWGGWRTNVTTTFTNTSLVDVTTNSSVPVVNSTATTTVNSTVVAGGGGSGVVDVLRNNDPITDIRINNALVDLSVLDGIPVIQVDSFNLLSIQLPYVTGIDPSVSTPTSVSGTVIPGATSTIDVSVNPDSNGNLSIGVNAQQLIDTSIVSIPLSIDASVTFASGLQVDSTINTVVNTPQITGWESGNYTNVNFDSFGTPTISYGGKNNGDEFDWSSFS